MKKYFAIIIATLVITVAFCSCGCMNTAMDNAGTDTDGNITNDSTDKNANNTADDLEEDANKAMDDVKDSFDDTKDAIDDALIDDTADNRDETNK